MMRALTVIMVFVVSGWLCMNIWVFCVPVNVSCAVNYFVLYKFSTEYRVAFKKQLGCCMKSNGISQIGSKEVKD
uniref:Uncharacterized protein n=1 Tax=Acrobeloides nanus TaxID=290746 RepID=A0A914D914_9BILA